MPDAIAPLMPVPVLAAAVTTIAAASTTGGLIGVLAIGYAWLGAVVLPVTEGSTASLVAWFVGVVVGLLALCALAVVASFHLLRRRRWAWRVLVALAPVTVVLGLAGAYYILPAATAAAAAAVFVLLLRRSTRDWISAAPQQHCGC